MLYAIFPICKWVTWGPCLENPRDRGVWWAAVYGVDRVRHDWSDLAAATWGPVSTEKGTRMVSAKKKKKIEWSQLQGLVLWRSLVCALLNKHLFLFESHCHCSLVPCFSPVWIKTSLWVQHPCPCSSRLWLSLASVSPVKGLEHPRAGHAGCGRGWGECMRGRTAEEVFFPL